MQIGIKIRFRRSPGVGNGYKNDVQKLIFKMNCSGFVLRRRILKFLISQDNIVTELRELSEFRPDRGVFSSIPEALILDCDYFLRPLMLVLKLVSSPFGDPRSYSPT